jgi:hypothetical protein
MESLNRNKPSVKLETSMPPVGKIACMLKNLEELSPTWLEQTLGVQVSHFTISGNPAFNSSIAHLELEYAPASGLPRRLLLKLNREFDGRNEVSFYRLASSSARSYWFPKLSCLVDTYRDWNCAEL